MVRVIEADDSALQSQIIKATNSQNKMPPSQLRMTDQIHRNIEEFFKKHGMFYDRRKGFYRDQGKSVKAIVSPGEVAQAVIAVLLQRPDDARARPGDYFKDSKGDVRYASIFGAGTYSMQAYWRVFILMRAVEFYLRKVGLSRAMQRNLKFYVASEIAVEKAGMANPAPAKIATLADISEPTDTDIQAVLARVKKSYERLSEEIDGDTVARGPKLLAKLKASANRRFRRKKSEKK